MSPTDSPAVRFVRELGEELAAPPPPDASPGRPLLERQVGALLDGGLDGLVRLEGEGIDVVGLLRLIVVYRLAEDQIGGARFAVSVPEGFPDRARYVDVEPHLEALETHGEMVGRPVDGVEGVRDLAATMRELADSVRGATGRIRGTTESGEEIDCEVAPDSVLAVPVDIHEVEGPVAATGQAGRPRDTVDVVLLAVRAHVRAVWPDAGDDEVVRVLADGLRFEMSWVDRPVKQLRARLARLDSAPPTFVGRAREIAARVPLEVGDHLGGPDVS